MRVRTVQLMRRVLTGAAAAALGIGVLAQSGAEPNPAASREWPTYGHDPGGMRFSPLTQITPANVGQLQVAWVYHMKPAASPTGCRRTGAAAHAVGDARPPPGRGRGRGGRASRRAKSRRSSSTARCIIATPYSRVVARRPDHRQGSSGPSSCRPAIRRRAASSTGPATRRRRRRSSSARATASCTRSTRRPASRTRPSATRASSI